MSLLLAVAGAAQAQAIAVSRNEAGGSIELMATQGNCPSGELVILSIASNGQFITGCWYATDGKVFVRYQDAGQRIYSINGFTITDYGRRKIGERGSN